jgi:hypothetical protein
MERPICQRLVMHGRWIAGLMDGCSAGWMLGWMEGGLLAGGVAARLDGEPLACLRNGRLTAGGMAAWLAPAGYRLLRIEAAAD